MWIYCIITYEYIYIYSHNIYVHMYAVVTSTLWYVMHQYVVYVTYKICINTRLCLHWFGFINCKICTSTRACGEECEGSTSNGHALQLSVSHWLLRALCQAHMSGRFWKFDSFCKALLQRRVGGHCTFPTIIFHWMPVIGKVYTETFIDVWMSFRVTCFVASSWSEPNSDMDFLVVNLLLRFSTQP